MRLRRLSRDPDTNSVLRANFRDVPRFISCGRVDVSSAGVEVTIPHKLGEVPDGIYPMIRTAGLTVEVPESSQKKWSIDRVSFVPSATGTIELFVFKL